MADERKLNWRRQHLRLLVGLDALAVAAATLFSQLLAFGHSTAVLLVRGIEIPYVAGILLTVPTWLALLGMAGCYDLGPFASIADEPRKIVSASAHFLAVMAVAYYLVHLDQLGRGFVIAIVPLASVLTLASRAAAHWQLRGRIASGHLRRRVVLAGPAQSVDELRTQLDARPDSGLCIVGTLPLNGTWTDELLAELDHLDADLVILSGTIEPGKLRKLTWQLEGSGIDCMVAPAASRFVGPQFDIRPIAGLPLLYVDRRATNPGQSA